MRFLLIRLLNYLNNILSKLATGLSRSIGVGIMQLSRKHNPDLAQGIEDELARRDAGGRLLTPKECDEHAESLIELLETIYKEEGDAKYELALIEELKACMMCPPGIEFMNRARVMLIYFTQRELAEVKAKKEQLEAMMRIEETVMKMLKEEANENE